MGEVLRREGDPALGRRPSTPQVELLRGRRIGQSDGGATARPFRPLQRNEEYRPETDPLVSDGLHFRKGGNWVERSQRGMP